MKRVMWCMVLSCLATGWAASQETQDQEPPVEPPAETPPKKRVVRPIVETTTATARPEALQNIPTQVMLIDESEIDQARAMTLGDLLAEKSVGQVRKFPGTLATINLRGYTSEGHSDQTRSRVSVMLDGRPCGSTNLAKFNLYDTQRVEVVRGPASVLYGSSAMGGVVNVIRKRGEGNPFVLTSQEAGSWGFWRSRVESGGKVGKFDYYATASRASFDEYDVPSVGEYRNTEYDDWSGTVNAGFEVAKGHRIGLGYRHFRGFDLGTPGSLATPNDPRSHTDKDLSNYDITYEGATPDSSVTWKAGGYLNREEDEFVTINPATPTIIRETIIPTETQGAFFQLASKLASTNRIVGGLSWDQIDSTREVNIGAPSGPTQIYDTYGIYAEDMQFLFDERLVLTAGVRYDYFSNSTSQVRRGNPVPNFNADTERFDEVTYRGGIVYKITPSLRARTAAGTAFKTPSARELAANDTNLAGTVTTIGNPDLDPEQSVSYEVGLDYEAGEFYSSLTHFYTVWDDKIATVRISPSPAVDSFTNIDGSIVQGFEWEGGYDFAKDLGWEMSTRLFISGVYNVRYDNEDPVEETQFGDKMLNMSRWLGTIGLSLAEPKADVPWDARVLLFYVGPQEVRNFGRTGGPVEHKGGFGVVNIDGGYWLTSNFRAIASVDNVFDKRYAYSIDSPMPERTYLVGVEARF